MQVQWEEILFWKSWETDSHPGTDTVVERPGGKKVFFVTVIYTVSQKSSLFLFLSLLGQMLTDFNNIW